VTNGKPPAINEILVQAAMIKRCASLWAARSSNEATFSTFAWSENWSSVLATSTTRFATEHLHSAMLQRLRAAPATAMTHTPLAH
jgi:hypothetical protein